LTILQNDILLKRSGIELCCCRSILQNRLFLLWCTAWLFNRTWRSGQYLQFSRVYHWSRRKNKAHHVPGTDRVRFVSVYRQTWQVLLVENWRHLFYFVWVGRPQSSQTLFFRSCRQGCVNPDW